GIRDFHVTGVQTCALPILGDAARPAIAQGRVMRILIALLAALLLAPAFATPPRLMLATGHHDGIEVADWLVSEKLDGVRGHWDRSEERRVGTGCGARGWRV